VIKDALLNHIVGHPVFQNIHFYYQDEKMGKQSVINSTAAQKWKKYDLTKTNIINVMNQCTI